MSGLREAIGSNPALWMAIGGFVIGALFGGLVYGTNFCTMGALSDVLNLSDWRRLRAWLLAAATAIAGTQALEALGVVELSRSMYLAPSVNWTGHIIGGAMFGFGMVLAGGCASRNLARAGGGDLRALVTLIVVGLVAYMAIGGILGPARAALEQATSVALKAPTQSLPGLAGLKGTGAGLLTGAIVIAILGWCFADGEFRSSPAHIASGLGVGVAVVAGWALTGLAFDELMERPVAPISLTFVRPTGDTIEWLERFTAARMPAFGVASVIGAILGAFVVAKALGRFRVTTFADTRDTLRTLAGASLMGLGGVMALGCTIGQAVTGVSTLSIGSLLTFVAIVGGGICGLKMLERWIMAEA